MLILWVLGINKAEGDKAKKFKSKGQKVKRSKGKKARSNQKA